MDWVEYYISLSSRCGDRWEVGTTRIGTTRIKGWNDGLRKRRVYLLHLFWNHEGMGSDVAGISKVGVGCTGRNFEKLLIDLPGCGCGCGCRLECVVVLHDPSNSCGYIV
jgi:hypothetical protein